MLHREEMDEDAWDTRETFAYFGRTFYMASALEVGLAHALLFAEFLHDEQQRLLATREDDFDKKQYQTRFDAYVEKQFAQTMGNIIRRVERLAEITDDLKSRIRAAKQRRDYLAHHFWRDRATEFVTARGRDQMRTELLSDMEMFEALDRDINQAMLPARKRLGIDDEVLAAYNKKIEAKLLAGEALEED
jgi:hypothetical protein